MTQPVEYRTAVDFLEPLEEEPYRAAARQMLDFMNRALIFIIESRSKEISAWGVAYALGLDVASRQPMAGIARQLKVTRAAISKETKEFQRGCSLPPSLTQKRAAACANYYDKRNAQLK